MSAAPHLLDPRASKAEGSPALELLRLERAEIGYRKPLLAPLDLVISRGDRLAVLGPNGGGKSTLVKSLLGLIPLVSGRRLLPTGKAPRLGYVPQAHRADPLYPLTAHQVVLQGRFGLIGLGRFPGKADRDFARVQLAKVGLLDRAEAPFRSLSGGQRQRVLLARALCGEPELLVLDEFTSDLDPAASTALLGEVSRLAQESGVSVLFVTHEISAAAAHSSRVAMVDSRRGVFDSGPTRELLTGERLSRLYGQNVHVEHRGGRTVVFVEAEGAP
jgi:ABC-type Mn2+/Zn2+ transport system ATPase subunit